MKRTLMQTYVKGSDEAVKLYQKAFDARLLEEVKHEDGTYYHSEMDVYGQVLAVAEYTGDEPSGTGNIMQFCLQFEKGEDALLNQAYEVLKEGSNILYPLGPCDFCTCMVDMIDKYGVRWCLFLYED